MESSMAEKSKVSKADDDGNGGGQDVNSAQMSTNESDEEDGNKPNETGLQARDGASVGAVAEGNVGAKGAWSKGTPKQKGTRNKGYGMPMAAFKDISSPTLEELANFDRTRSFFFLC